MSNKLFVLIAGIAAITLFFGFLLAPAPPAPKTYKLKIVKVEGVWRVADATDYSKRKVKVKKKDTIVWTVEETDTYFQFPANLFNPAGAADSLIDGYTKFVRDGKKLKLKVKDDAPAGTYEYAVFCITDGVFAQGESPPKIVIE
jgi:hypothetical protein